MASTSIAGDREALAETCYHERNARGQGGTYCTLIELTLSCVPQCVQDLIVQILVDISPQVPLVKYK